MGTTKLTAGRIAEFACPEGKLQAFLWDSKAPGLALRVTKGGSRAYVFQGRLRDGQTVRLTIGQPIGADGSGVWAIPNAQAEARRLQSLIDQGKDPRREKAEVEAADRLLRETSRASRRRHDVSGLEAWTSYCTARKQHWSERNYADHLSFAAEGGRARRRSIVKETIDGPLRSLLTKPLASIDEAAVFAWVVRETKRRPARAQLGFRLLRAFMNWCGEQSDYSTLVQLSSCRAKRVREALSKPLPKADSLQREQLPAWFAAVRQDPNPVVAAYLQCLLLTGARREEIAELRWEDVDFQWKSLRIRDKVDGERVIPLTPYVAHLFAWLPHRDRNPYVFSSATGTTGRLRAARPNHVRALRVAGLPHVTLHGLRRSFGTLSEWVEVPVGIVAQLQGHKPSATAEKHYRVRPLDLLRMWHERIEAWILEAGGVAFAAPTTTQARLVSVHAA